jgi:hypothetical protein
LRFKWGRHAGHILANAGIVLPLRARLIATERKYQAEDQLDLLAELFAITSQCDPSGRDGLTSLGR